MICQPCKDGKHDRCQQCPCQHRPPEDAGHVGLIPTVEVVAEPVPPQEA